MLMYRTISIKFMTILKYYILYDACNDSFLNLQHKGLCRNGPIANEVTYPFGFL